jgi:hypothetical protein
MPIHVVLLGFHVSAYQELSSSASAPIWKEIKIGLLFVT